MNSNVQGYHKHLKLLYTVEGGGIIFQDDVFYKKSEIEILKNHPDSFVYDLIHEAKKLFEAEVVDAC